MSPRSQQDLRAIVRDHGLRATSSRLAVLGVLQAAESPLSHGEVTHRVANRGWDPTTIYRNLSDFVDAGLARRTNVGHVWRFELLGAGHDKSVHPHFVCTECGSIACLPKLALALPRIGPRAVRNRQVDVQLHGVCDGCS